MSDGRSRWMATFPIPWSVPIQRCNPRRKPYWLTRSVLPSSSCSIRSRQASGLRSSSTTCSSCL